ncbi:MAG: hypothetical protein J1E38_09135 [Paramuribaculum sp.]|nr:hypothetical protein [Paramuribaculum sp.]
MEETKIKIRPTLMAMKEGDLVKFPILQLKSVRTQASELGAIYNRQFSTRMNREEKTIEVRRTM